MRMTFANARAWSPFVTCSPAHWLAYLATAGSSAAPNVIPSALIESRVVESPLAPMKIATTPKRINKPPARNPPISQTLLRFIAPPPGEQCISWTVQVFSRAGGWTSGDRRAARAAEPRRGAGNYVRRRLPALRGDDDRGACDAHPCVDRNASIRQPENGVQVQLRDRRDVEP